MNSPFTPLPKRWQLLASMLLMILVGFALPLLAEDLSLVRSLADPSGVPLFVPAALAGQPDGKVAWQILGPLARRIYHSVAEAPRLPAPAVRPGEPELLGAPDPYYSRPLSTCLYYAPGSFEDPGRAPEQTLRAAAGGARGIYQGRVVSINEGFFGGDIGSVIDLEIQETLKPFAEVAQTKRLYLYFPAASFRIGSTSFCKADPAYPPRPEIGDDLLVFIRRPPLDEDRRILLPEPDGVFIQKSSGKLSVPHSLAADPGCASFQSMSQLAVSVAVHVAQDPRQKLPPDRGRLILTVGV